MFQPTEIDLIEGHSHLLTNVSIAWKLMQLYTKIDMLRIIPIIITQQNKKREKVNGN